MRDTDGEMERFGMTMRPRPLQGGQRMDEEREQAAEWGEKSRKGRFTEVIWRPNTREKKWEVKVLQKKEMRAGI